MLLSGCSYLPSEAGYQSMVAEATHHAPVLLAEDEETDVFLMHHAFTTAGIQNQLVAVTNGEDAIAYLSGTGRYADRLRFPLPCMVLTDLHMPGASGFDFLVWLKQQSHLRHIP